MLRISYWLSCAVPATASDVKKPSSPAGSLSNKLHNRPLLISNIIRWASAAKIMIYQSHLKCIGGRISETQCCFHLHYKDSISRQVMQFTCRVCMNCLTVKSLLPWTSHLSHIVYSMALLQHTATYIINNTASSVNKSAVINRHCYAKKQHLWIHMYNLILVLTAAAGSENTNSGRARFRNVFL